MPRVYPPLAEDTKRRLEAVKMISVTDPDYFTDPACPYPWLEEIVRGVSTGERVKLFDDTQDGGQAADTVLGEVQNTIEEMKGLEGSLIKSEAADRLAFYKTYTSMLERWTNLKEKLINMKMMSEFQKTVISAMDEILTKDQRQEFKNKLKGLIT